MTILAIDPGKSGGMAFYAPSTGFMEAFPMPDDMVEAIHFFQKKRIDVAYVEKVSGFIGSAQPGSRMFEFGKNYGFILGALAALEIPIVLVTPQKWQKHVGLGTSGGDKSAWKKKLKAEASRRFPKLKTTLKTADALLILDYAIAQGK